jgi:hypothetical protein
MSQRKGGSDPSPPEQVKDNNCKGLELMSGSTGQSSLMPVRWILIDVDAEPSTSNQTSFREDEPGARVQDTESPQSAVLRCVGANFADYDMENIRPRHPRKRSLDTSIDLISRKQRTLRKGIRAILNLKITKADTCGIGNIASRSADTDDETIGHADDIDADIGYSAVATNKKE